MSDDNANERVMREHLDVTHGEILDDDMRFLDLLIYHDRTYPQCPASQLSTTRILTQADREAIHELREVVTAPRPAAPLRDEALTSLRLLCYGASPTQVQALLGCSRRVAYWLARGA